MNDNRRAKLIADVIKHLENLDGDELGSKMAPPPLDEAEGGMGDSGMEGDKGPMDAAIVEIEGAPKKDDEEMDDDELEELEKMSS